MKQIIMIMALTLMCQITNAQDVDDIMSKYKDIKNATYVVENDIMDKLNQTSELVPQAKEGIDIVKNLIKGNAQVLAIDNCSLKVKKAITKAVNKLKDYNTLITKSDNMETTKILTKHGDEGLSDLIIFHTGEDCTLIAIKRSI